MLFHRRQAETVAIPYRTATIRHTVLAKNGPKVRDLEGVRDLQERDLERSHCKTCEKHMQSKWDITSVREGYC